MLHLLLSGCYGKMGRVVAELVSEHEDTMLIGIDTMPGKEELPFPVFHSFGEINIESDVIIDFSHHSVILPLLDYVERTETPAVICTTGLDEEIQKRIRDLSNTVPILRSGNMSVGINVLLKLVKKAAAAMGETFDIEIIEKHHNRKVDSPSGTAYMIANTINEALHTSKTFTHGRHGKDTLRKKEELGIHAVRGGTIVGEHSVIFAGTDEVIEITHRATSRKIFGVGAVKAAYFLLHQKPGLYSMDDVL